MKHKLALIAAFVGFGLWAQSAAAVTINIGTALGGPIGTSLTNTYSDASGSGSKSFAAGIGAFADATGTGNGNLALPGILYSGSIDVSSSTAGTLWMYVSATGVTQPPGKVQFASSFTINTDGVAGVVPPSWIIEVDTYLNTSNSPYGATGTNNLLATQCYGAACAPVLSPQFDTGAGPYSVIALYKITSGGTIAHNVSLTANIVGYEVPLPAALPLFMSAVGGFGLVGWRRRRRPGADA